MAATEAAGSPAERPDPEGGATSNGAQATAQGSPPVPEASAGGVGDSRGDGVAEMAQDAADALLADDDAGGGPLPAPGGTSVEAPRREATTKRSGEAVTASPLLVGPRVKDPEAIVLFVHGGDVEGYLQMRRGDPGYLRMVPFARDVERRSRGRIGGALVRLAVRGWNEPDRPAVEDARWALRELRRRHPDAPIAVAGHSMGGRVVLDLAGGPGAKHPEGEDVEVAARVLLAPWACGQYDPRAFVDAPLLALHGRHDTVTDPEETEAFVTAVRAAGGDARFVSLPGWHAMLLRPNRWHKLTSRFLIENLLG